MTTLYLYVDSDDGSLTGWSTVGSSPYLGVINYPTAYIYARINCRERGVFGFLDSADLGTINTVKAQFYGRYTVSPEISGDEAYFKNNAVWSLPYLLYFTTSWDWQTADLTSDATLSPFTWAKINALVTKLHHSNLVNENTNCQIDCARLAIDYTPTVVGVPKHYSDGLVCIGWIGLLRKLAAAQRMRSLIRETRLAKV
jgi:hypothetical protein